MENDWDKYVTIKPVYGHIELRESCAMIDGEFWLGGYSIHYDENGCLVKKTEFEPMVKLTYG
jgi:hypothetical protein